MADGQPWTPSAEFLAFEKKLSHMKFKIAPPKLPPKRRSLASISSNASSAAMSPPSLPCPSPRPTEEEVKVEDVASPTKFLGNKESGSDSLPDMTSISASKAPSVNSDNQSLPMVVEEAQWEERHYRSPYLEDLTARWRSDYAITVPNPIVYEYLGKPNIPKDSRKQCDLWSASKMANYLMDRIPEEILNETPIDRWDSSSIVRTPRKKISMSNGPGSSYSTTFHSYSPTYDTEGNNDEDEPLFAETKPPGMDAEVKPPAMDEDDEKEEGLLKALNAEDILMEMTEMDGDDDERYNEPICKEEPSTSQYLFREVDANVEPEETEQIVGVDAGPILIYPNYLTDRTAPRQMERDLLSVVCALCDIKQCNVSRSNWFGVILRKAEQTMQQLIAIENRRRRDLEIAAEERNHLKNRIAILAAKKRSFREAVAAGVHIRMGNQRTLAEGRVPPSVANAITLRPSDSNDPQRASMLKNYRITNGIASPIVQPGPSYTVAPSSRQLNASPYQLVNQRKPQSGIPAATLMTEPGQPIRSGMPIRRPYSPQGRYAVSTMVRRPPQMPQMMRRPMVATIRFPNAAVQQRIQQPPQGLARPQPAPRGDSPPFRYFTDRPS